MSTPQPAIFTTGTAFHWFLHYRLDQRTDPDAVRAPIGALRQQAAEVGVHCVVGFGAGLAPALLGDDAPGGLVPFETVEGEHARAIGTQEAVFYWLHSDRHDLDFEVALASRRGLDGLATLARETPSWVYRDSQDLTGFIDGTANPEPDEAPAVALIPDGEPGAGGSYVLAQRWIHDLDAFHGLPLEEQEAIIGRTKDESFAIPDRPPTAHITRAELVVDGEEQEIYRRSVAYGTVEEAGLYFLAFSHDVTIFQRMLARMYGTSGDGIHDRLTEFTTPASGAFYFAPPLEALERAGLT